MPARTPRSYPFQYNLRGRVRRTSPRSCSYCFESALNSPDRLCTTAEEPDVPADSCRPPPPQTAPPARGRGRVTGSGTGRTMRCGALALALLCALPLGAAGLELPETGSGLQAGRKEASPKGGDGMRWGDLGGTPLGSLAGGGDARGGGGVR